MCVSVFGGGGGTFYFRKKSRRATPLFPPPLCAFFVLLFAFGSEGGHVLFYDGTRISKRFPWGKNESSD